MARYINADELKADHFVASTTANTTNYLYVSLSQIENAPTADVVERKDLDTITEAHEQIGYEKGYRDGYAQAIEDAEMGERRNDAEI